MPQVRAPFSANGVFGRLVLALSVLSIVGGCNAGEEQRNGRDLEEVAGCYELTWQGDSTYPDGILPRRFNLSWELQPFPPEGRDSAGFAAVLPAAQAPSDTVTWWYGHLGWWRATKDSLVIILGGGGEGLYLTSTRSGSGFAGSAERWTDYGDSGDFRVRGTRIDCVEPEIVVHEHAPPASEYPLPPVYAKWPYRSSAESP